MREMTTPFPRRLAAWTIALAVVALAAGAFAQGTSSSLRGTVRDTDGAVAEAVVTATELTSGFHRSAKTGADGGYSLPGLTPGAAPRFRLTEIGRIEGARSFQDEFGGLTRQAHGACGPGCWCNDPRRIGEPCPASEPPPEPPGPEP